MRKKNNKRFASIVLASVLAASGFSFSPKKAEAFTSNTELDNHVIFQSFSLYQPYDSNMYNVLSSKGDYLKDLGISDVWMPPAYRSFDMARYLEGYAITDRYDLGEFNQGPNGTQATKYGTSSELKGMVNSLHEDGLKVQMDLVPNQLMGMPGREAVYVKRTDDSGNQFTNPYTTGQTSKTTANIYLAYTKGGGQGQAKYGYIKEWNKNYFNGTSLQGQGLGRVMTDDKGTPYRYLGQGNKDNYLPAWLNEAAEVGKINTVDSYLPVDGWYAAKDAATTDQYWKPMLINYANDKGYLPFLAQNGFATMEDIINGDNGQIAGLTNQYIASQPAYGYGSEEKTNANDNSGIDSSDQLLFVNKDGSQLHKINNTIFKGMEFLIGNDIDNSNPEVQKEQKNWMKWLLESYKFDGFRIDAASHYDSQILLDELAVKKEVYGKAADNQLSYIESYGEQQNGFLNAHQNGQLAMDGVLFYSLETSLSKTKQPLKTIVTNSAVNRAGTGNAIPNWSFVNNHDQEKNRVNQIMLDLYGINSYVKYGNETPKSFEAMYDKATEKKALDIYNADMEKADKKYAPSNVPSQYAFLLTNKDTVPTVFYGDMFKTNASYMAEPTIYNEVITNLLKVRKQYAAGNQKVTYYQTNTGKVEGQDLIASVRFGDNRETGAATVIGTNPNTDKTIKVDMGAAHANQVFVDGTGFHTEKLVTDSKGVLTIHVKGTKNAFVKGYLGVWVPASDKGGWVKEGTKWFYVYPTFAENATDWEYIDGQWYFFAANGEMVSNKWIQTNNKWYFLGSSGEMKTGWVLDGGKWYFLDDSGVMKTGWVYTGGSWYFLDDSGAMETGWVKTGGHWYFLDNNGAMKTGWVYDGGKWYFLDKTNGDMKTGWVYTGNKWYFLFNDGSMAANTKIGQYKVGPDGAWIN